MADTQGEERGKFKEAAYCVADRCPGFEEPDEGEVMLPGYVRPSLLHRTIEQWVAESVDPLAEEENHYFMRQVTPAWMNAEQHMPTKDNPDGLFGRMGFELASCMFYSPPQKPDDPKDDHAILMEWLTELERAVEPVKELLDEFEETFKSIRLGGMDEGALQAKLEATLVAWKGRLGRLIQSGMRKKPIRSPNPQLN